MQVSQNGIPSQKAHSPIISQKNSTLAGIKDSILTKSLNDLLTVNMKMLVAITKSRKDINDRSTFAVEALKEDVAKLEAIKSDIVAIETPLKMKTTTTQARRMQKKLFFLCWSL